MSLLSKISTTLATHFALRLFFTPLKFPVPKREEASRNAAKRHKLHTGQSDFSLFEWPGQGPKIILVHGWSGRATQFFKMVDYLTVKGFHVFAIEAPGHGDSRHQKTHMLEFVNCIETAQQAFGPFEFAIGHSLGGMAIFNALQSNLTPKKVIVIGTPVNIRCVVHDFCKKVHASKAVEKRIISTIEKRYDLAVEDASTDTLAKKYNPPGLIIHDEHDQDVGANNARQLATFWSHADLLITQGLGHRKVLMDDEVIERIYSCLKS